MSFLSGLAALVAILLMVFGVNVSELNGAQTPAVATESPAPEETTTPEPSGLPVESAQPTDAPDGIVTGAQQTSGVPVITAQPTAAPTEEVAAVTANMTAAQIPLADSEIEADAQTLATNIFNSMIQLTPYDAPGFVTDNAKTHLVARWVDYMQAKMELDDSLRLSAFNRPGVVPALKSTEADGSGWTCRVQCALSLKKTNGDDYTPAIVLVMHYAAGADGTHTVDAAGIEGDSDYDALSAQAGESVSSIDIAVDAAIAALQSVNN